jgi:hypothetical protein
MVAESPRCPRSSAPRQALRSTHRCPCWRLSCTRHLGRRLAASRVHRPMHLARFFCRVAAAVAHPCHPARTRACGQCSAAARQVPLSLSCRLRFSLHACVRRSTLPVSSGKHAHHATEPSHPLSSRAPTQPHPATPICEPPGCRFCLPSLAYIRGVPLVHTPPQPATFSSAATADSVFLATSSPSPAHSVAFLPSFSGPGAPRGLSAAPRRHISPPCPPERPLTGAAL